MIVGSVADRLLCGVQEIGTHYTRRTNDVLQPWHGKKKRRKFQLSGFLETEEGLATLNNVLHESREPHLRPYIWQGALHYYCCCRAFELPFSQVSPQTPSLLLALSRVFSERDCLCCSPFACASSAFL
jgi:hypothetical protein